MHLNAASYLPLGQPVYGRTRVICSVLLRVRCGLGSGLEGVTVGELLGHTMTSRLAVADESKTAALLDPATVEALLATPIEAAVDPEEAADAEVESDAESDADVDSLPATPPETPSAAAVSALGLPKATYRPAAAGLVMAALAGAVSRLRERPVGLAELIRTELLEPAGQKPFRLNRRMTDPTACIVVVLTQHSRSSGAEAWLGDVPAEAAADGTVAAVSHGYAAELQPLLSGGGGGPDGGGGEVGEGMAGLRGEFPADSAAANAEAVRSANGRWAPSLNSYASAVAVARVWTAAVGGGLGSGSSRERGVLPPDVVAALLTPVAEDVSALDGRRVWGPGLQLKGEGREQAVYSRSFGGPLVVCVPEEEVVAVVLVNQLTLECTAVRRLVALVGKAVAVDLDPIFADGMF